MLKLINRRTLSLFHRNRYLFNSNKDVKDAKEPKPEEPISFTQTVQKHTFLTNVYGIQTKNHIFPNKMLKFEFSEQQIKFYQKSSPNYVVALVRKVLDEAMFPQGHYQWESLPVSQKFYNIATYCRVQYKGTKMELTGLYRSKIRQIQKVQVEDLQEQKVGEEGVVIPDEQQNQQLQGEQNFEQVIQGNEFSIAEMIKGTRKSGIKKKRLGFYSCKVSKLQDLPLVVTPRLEIKFKYLIQTYIQLYSAMGKARGPVMFNIIDIGTLLDQIATECSSWNANKQDIQKCLEALDLEERIDNVQKLTQKTRYYKSYLGDLQRAAQNNLRNKKVHEYYTEMLKVGKQILDGKKAKELFLEKVNKAFYNNLPPDDVKQVFQSEREKYQMLDDNSMQAGVVKAYLDELSKIPYGIKSEEIFDIQNAKKILEEQHYGMEDAKSRILEIIAVGKLKTTLKGKIFCFVGGPGLGKTTFAKSIAKALNRKFYNISLGGVSDSSALKGHRRTYIGAYSGKIIQALKNCGTNNPVILLDQIDKMGSGSQGDPRSELLEILDPNQNNSFVDNFVDIGVDLSNALFICSANYQENISKPLLDRMQKIHLSSYTNQEKKQIFKRHLLRRCIEKTGVKPEQFDLKQQAVDSLIQDYHLGEPGVRYLQKHIANILEKTAYKIVTGQPVPIQINKSNLSKFIGTSFRREKDHTKIEAGVAIGLGGGRYGGRLTYIEAFKKSFLNNKKQRKREFMFTGSLGDIFKQAMNISYTYARNFLYQNVQSNRYLYDNEIHIHAPEGASKKDGSTDSLTIVSALISLALNKQVKKGIAVTGQITLYGKVLRTHAIKQKILVAKREKINEVIVPYQNFNEVQMLKEEIKEGIKFHFVKDYHQVYAILFS